MSDPQFIDLSDAELIQLITFLRNRPGGVGPMACKLQDAYAELFRRQHCS